MASRDVGVMDDDAPGVRSRPTMVSGATPRYVRPVWWSTSMHEGPSAARPATGDWRC